MGGLFEREQVSAVATDAGRMKMLSEVHLTFMKFARDIVPEQAFFGWYSGRRNPDSA